jgi:hypothetical protein
MKRPGWEWSILIFPALILIAWGCQNQQPVGPSKTVSLGITLPVTHEIQASLLGSASNDILWRVDGAGMTTMKGTYGPFSTPASSGSVVFYVDVPIGPARLLSLQLNDVPTGTPLALGAAQFDVTSQAIASGQPVVVEMGSVTRNCYFVNQDQLTTGLLGDSGSTYGFATDTLVNLLASGGYDVGMESAGVGTEFEFVDAQNSSMVAVSSIAYLGNGNLVDFDVSPPRPNSFFPTSPAAKQYAISVGAAPAAATTNIQAGDVYFLDLWTIPGAHAWIQVTDPGDYVPPTAGGGYGPSFRFRVNSTLPYYAYDPTPNLTACSAAW